MLGLHCMLGFRPDTYVDKTCQLELLHIKNDIVRATGQRKVKFSFQTVDCQL